MTESQSRYSIVERLTSQKIGLIDNENRIDEDIEELKNEVDAKKIKLENYQDEADEDIQREVKKRELEIEDYKNTLKFRISQKAAKVIAVTKKIEQIDQALKTIQKISETAPSPQEQA